MARLRSICALERWRTHEIRVHHWSFFWITGQTEGLVSKLGSLDLLFYF